MTKHKWHDEIVAWAGGAVIEYKRKEGWNSDNNPTWHGTECIYRIKPNKPVYEYQVVYKEKGFVNYSAPELYLPSKRKATT